MLCKYTFLLLPTVRSNNQGISAELLLLVSISFSSFLFWESRSAPAGLKPILATFVPLLTLARYYIGGSGVLSLLRFHPSLLFCSLELIIVYCVRSFLSIDISHKYVRSFSMFFTVYIVDFSCYTMYIIGKV